MTELAFVVPGSLDQLTGGYLYDRHVIDGLRSRGHAVKVIELAPNDREAALAELADGTTTVIDGLAFPHFEEAGHSPLAPTAPGRAGPPSAH